MSSRQRGLILPKVVQPMRELLLDQGLEPLLLPRWTVKCTSGEKSSPFRG